MDPLIDAPTLDRYRRNYGLGPEVEARHVRAHWDLERVLTAKLKSSTPETRWSVFEACYSELYGQLPWLNQPHVATKRQLRQWLTLVRPGARVFEVGSGGAALLKFLAAKKFDCTATEITRERGSKFAPAADGLRWRTTDGVHLDQFEDPGSYDVVIATEVIEHFHPDDLDAHFASARAILRPGGRYILTTPHASTGPHDLSAVFGRDVAECMHLKEYSVRDLRPRLRAAGFRSVKAVFPPARIYDKAPALSFTSGAYLRYLAFWDWLELALRLDPSSRRKFRRLIRLLGVGDSIWLVAET